MDTTRLLKTFSGMSNEQIAQLVERNETLKSELSLSTVSHTGIMCPVIQTEISAKCTVAQCPFYTDMPLHHNCAIVYSTKQGDAFGTKDLAILYRKPHTQIKTAIEDTLTSLKSLLNPDVELEQGFFPLEGVCVTCEAPIEEDGLSIEDCEYCSAACSAKLTPTKAKQGYLPA